MFDLDKAAKAGVDEAALKLSEILHNLLDGHKIVITFEKKETADEPAGTATPK